MTVPRAPSRCPLRVGIFSALSVAWLVSGTGRAQYDPIFNTPGMSRERPVPLAVPLPIFFPPNPPPLGRPISHLNLAATGQTMAPPRELALYVNEAFYAPLGTKLALNSFDEKQRQTLDAYRSARNLLLEELQNELIRLQDAEPAARRTAFTILAQRQTPRLMELEATAEQLRGEITNSDIDWSALRDWHLGERNARGDSPAELAAVMRAHAFYQAGLLPAQRQLLREIVIELTSGAEDAATATARQPYLFFSPHLTRVTVPESAPPEVAAKIAQFVTKKSALKKGLFDTVLANDAAMFGFVRTNAMRALAARQAPALAELEQLADEIREGLVAVPEMHPTVPPSPLPPLLTRRILDAVEARTTLQKATRTKVDEILAELPANFPVVMSTTIDPGGVKIRLMRREGRGRFITADDPLIARTVQRINDVGEDHRQQHVALDRSLADLRDDIGRALGSKSTPRQVSDALQAVVNYNILRENDDGYRDYRIAVFEPGLTPEQRRLLLGGALTKLDVPLPSGEYQPTLRQDSW